MLAATSVVSPRIALAMLSQEVAGTSLQHQRHFERAAESFRRRVMDLMNRDIALNPRSRAADYRAGPALWRKTGAFEYTPQPLAVSVARSGAPLMVLFLWMVMLVILTVATARHLRVLAS